MTPRATAGWVAAVSGGLLAIGLVAASVAAAAGWIGVRAVVPGLAAPGMMGPAMMGGGAMPMGPGMMRGMGPMMGGGAYGPGVAGSGAIAGAIEVKIQALNFRFDPSEIRLPKDTSANITLTNTTSVLHDLTIPALGVQLVAPAGATRTLGLSSIPAGRYVAYCSVPGHADAGMRATVLVQ